ncbi:BrnA antitoxin family protein [Paludibaculum fermentans]|uniref:BrnA antitoxin family protein n=1 Tax=Paludibaculum fermentans TaxID=1473598 RepID=A0A7S7SIH1_PALFE|nr:BrnA antitoxin family protein [Paludibaculum fermentans]QOY85688.1 BrnA antitoxin family protein [Paludibaculum fermentans]
MKKLTLQQKTELEALAGQPDSQIDTSDIPEVSFSDKAVVGKFYRPIKKPVSVRLDADVLDWLKRSGPGYQRRINLILRLEMQRSLKT